MSYFLSIIGMIGAIAIIKYRKVIGDSIGEAQWMRHVGGVHNFLVIIAILLFFWCVATITGTLDLFFAPFKMLIPQGVVPDATTGF